MNAQPAATTVTTTFDLDAALEEATVAMRRVSAANKDTRALSQTEREAALASLAAKLGLNPLSNPVRFIALQGGEALYVTRQGTDQIAARLKINRETTVGPEIRDIAGVKVVFCQVRATEPGGRSDVATATLPLKDPCNDLMKAETKAKRRAVLSLVGLGLLTEEDAEGALASEAAAPQGVTPADAVKAWLADLARVGRVRELRAVYGSHASALRITGRDGRDDVRAWLCARGLLAIDAEVTAVLSTLTEGVCEALEIAALVPGENPAPKPDADALVRAMRKVRSVVADEHSITTARKILARSYGAAENLSNTAAWKALADRAAQPEPDGDDEPPPTGTDGPRGGGSEDTDAQGPQASVRLVREESADPLVTNAAAWVAHLATKHSEWEVRTGFLKRRSAFDAEGVLDAREKATLARLTDLGVRNPHGLLYPTPKDQAA